MFLSGRKSIRRWAAISVIAVVGLAPLAACSSDDSSSSTSTTVSTGPTVTDATCPFTGTVSQTSGGATSVATTPVTGVTTSKEGCVDNIQLTMSSGVGAWTASYATGGVKDASGATVNTGGSAALVISITGGQWKGNGQTPTTVLPVQLDYVESINVVNGPNNALLIVFGLDKQRPYQASDSSNPAYISLGIG
jgi:hypothetical protein